MVGIGFVIQLLKLYTGYAFVVAFLLQSSIVLALAMLAFCALFLIRRYQIRSQARLCPAIIKINPGKVYYPRFPH